jgi:pimeloyl-ACP methyl ester carboxylesterase
MWKTHMQRLDGYHCLAPDFPGFGRTGGEEWVSLDDTADRLIELIETRCIGGCAHIVGLSLGGSLALLLMARAPHLVDHAIVDGAGVLPLAGLPAFKLGLLLMQPFMKTEPVIRMLANSIKVPADEYAEFRDNLRMMSPSSFRRAFFHALSQGMPPGLEKFSGPALFVAGEREPKAVHQSNVMLSRRLPHAESRMAPKMAHGWYAEAPDLHYYMIRAWIENAPLPSELLPVRSELAS